MMMMMSCSFCSIGWQIPDVLFTGIKPTSLIAKWKVLKLHLSSTRNNKIKVAAGI